MSLSPALTATAGPRPSAGAALPAVQLEHVSAAYDDTDVLEDLSLTVFQGEFVALIGPNGGGKTTLLKLLIGLLSPTTGTIRVLGRSIAQALREVAYVPQEIRFDRDFPVTALDVARMGRLGRRPLLARYSRQDTEAAEGALERLQVHHLRNRPIGALSGGERQRVYIARALASDPRLLLLDEPLANVDPEARVTIEELLATLGQEMTILMSTHDVGGLLPEIDRIGYLSRTLGYYGSPEDAPGAIRERFRCPAQVMGEHLAEQAHIHVHEAAR
ncbi:MAG: metal ABC transporter ATP-binding protein [Anaerolineae bacterium]|nr:metal ABC transporter ATP-binding protein [Chloroflexota bacterium]